MTELRAVMLSISSHSYSTVGRFQVELLAIYGGDPGQPDFGGQTAADTARAEKQTDLAERLLELEFETTDRLTIYLCGRKPEHRQGQHFVIPEMASGGIAVGAAPYLESATCRDARRRLHVSLALATIHVRTGNEMRLHFTCKILVAVYRNKVPLRQENAQNSGRLAVSEVVRHLLALYRPCVLHCECNMAVY